MIDFNKIEIKFDNHNSSKNKNDYFTLNINNNIIKNKKGNNDFNQNEENECINIIKEQEQENYIVHYKNKNSDSPTSKEKINYSSQFIHNNKKNSKSFNHDRNYKIINSKNFLDEPDIFKNTKEEESNKFNIVQPSKIEQKEIEKEKIKEEKDYSFIMSCISLLLLIKFPPVGILFFFAWMIKKHKKRMIIIIVILIIFVILFSTLIYIFYWKK